MCWTPTHADHITASGVLRDATGCKTLLGQEAHSHCVSETLGDGQILQLGHIQLTAIHTPGHTPDSYSFLVEASGQSYLFSGDTLLIRGTGRTDFQQGSARQQFHSLHRKILTLPDHTLVYPGHDYKGWTMSTIGEEKRHNPRLQFNNEADYIAFMDTLNLPNPKLMDIAVPANRACGKT